MASSKRRQENADTGPLPGDISGGQQPIEGQPQPPTQVPVPDQGAQLQQQPTMAPTPTNPFAPPSPGMIPLAWGYPQQSPVGQVMQHGDVNQVEDINMQTPELSQEEMEVVEEYRKWKKNKLKETSLSAAKKMMWDLIAEGYGEEEAAEEVAASTNWVVEDLLDEDLLDEATKSKKPLKEEVPAPVVPEDPQLAAPPVPEAPAPQVPYEDEEVDMDMDMSDEMGLSKEELVDELGDVIVDINRIFQDAGGVLPVDDDMMGEDDIVDGGLIEGDDMMDEDPSMEDEGSMLIDDPMLAERVANIKARIAEKKKKKGCGPKKGLEERVAAIKERIAARREALKESDSREARIQAIKEKIAAKKKEGKTSVSSREERIAALKEKIKRARMKEATLDPKSIDIRFPAGTSEPNISTDAAGMAMDGLLGADELMESVRNRTAKRRKMIAEMAAKREAAKIALGQIDDEAAQESEDYDAIHTPGVDKPVTRKDMGESKIKKEKVATPEMLVERYKEKSEFSFNELIRQGFLG